MNLQRYHNSLTTQKSVAVCFKDVKTEEKFSSQDQTLVKLAICNNLFWTKNHNSANSLPQRSLTHSIWWMDQQWTHQEHQDDLTSHTQSWKMKKIVPQEIASRLNTKKNIFRKHEVKNQKLSTLKTFQHIFNALTSQKSVAVYFKDVKTEETSSSQDQKLDETTILWRQLFSDKKSPQRKFASATIANSVDLMNGTTMNTSRWLN